MSQSASPEPAKSQSGSKAPSSPKLSDHLATLKSQREEERKQVEQLWADHWKTLSESLINIGKDELHSMAIAINARLTKAASEATASADRLSADLIETRLSADRSQKLFGLLTAVAGLLILGVSMGTATLFGTMAADSLAEMRQARDYLGSLKPQHSPDGSWWVRVDPSKLPPAAR